MARSYDVQLQGFSWFDKLPQNLAAVVNGAFRRLMADAQQRARENVTQGRPGLIARRGNLYRSIKLGPYKQWQPGGIGEQKLYASAPYAATHEPPDGRRYTRISAKNKPYLVFRLWNPQDVTAPTGPWRRAKSVLIPARPFLAPAAEAAVRLWPEYVEETMQYLRGNA